MNDPGCPLLKKYYANANSEKEWAANICIKYCPLSQLACMEDSSQHIREQMKILLEQTRIPCPKCDAKDNWEEHTEDGIHCFHCGFIIYKLAPMKIKLRGRWKKKS